MKLNYKSILTLTLPIVLLVIFRIPSLFESYWYGDEAIYAAVAQEIANGKDLYAQTWDHKPPLIFWVFYPAALIGWSKGFVMLRAFNLLLGILTLVFVNKILLKKVSKVARFVALLFLSLTLGSTVIEGNILNAEVIFLTFNTLAILLLFEKRQFILLGLLGFLSLVTKVPGFVEFALIYLAFIVVYFRDSNVRFIVKSLAKSAVGFLVPLAFLIGYFILNGTIADFTYANATFNGIYSLHQSNVFVLLGREFPNTYLQLVSFVTIFGFTTFIFYKKRLTPFTYIALNLFVISSLASLLSAKNYSHYFLQVLPAMSLLIALIVSESKKLFNLKNITVTAIISLLFIPMLLVFKSGGKVVVYARPIEYYSSFTKGYLLRDNAAKRKFWWGNGTSVETTKRYADYLDDNYLEYSPVYIYSDKPWIIALTERDLTNKFVVWFHLAYLEEHLMEEIPRMQSANLFVFDKGAQMLPLVEDMLNREYQEIDTFEDLVIYKRLEI